MSYINKTKLTWNEITTDSITLAKTIKNESPIIAGIVCVTRGGLVASGLLSNLLNVKQIDLLCMSSYNHEEQKQNLLNVLLEPNIAKQTLGENWIVIDELVDTGKSIDYVKKILPKAKVYALYSKLLNCKNLDGFVKYYEKDTWLEFPWELEL